MKYTAHEAWLKANPSPYTADLIDLINETRSRPAFNATEYNNDRIHVKIIEEIRYKMKCIDGIALFNQSLHGVVGFRLEDGVAKIIKADLVSVPVEQFEATDAGLEHIYNQIVKNNFHYE